MTRWLIAIAAQLLQPQDREAALGDLAEANESAWQGLADVLSLAIHRQAVLWKDWRPWLAGFGLTAPNSFLLMGFSVHVSLMFLGLTEHKVRHGSGSAMVHDLLCLLGQIFLLLACSWASGFVAASVSRRTLWVTAVLCVLPCLLCSVTFRIESLSRISLLLFLLPAILGVRRGLRVARVTLRFAIALAVAITVLMVLSGGASHVFSLALLWPACYLVGARSESVRKSTR